MADTRQPMPIHHYNWRIKVEKMVAKVKNSFHTLQSGRGGGEGYFARRKHRNSAGDNHRGHRERSRETCKQGGGHETTFHVNDHLFLLHYKDWRVTNNWKLLYSVSTLVYLTALYIYSNIFATNDRDEKRGATKNAKKKHRCQLLIISRYS